MKKNKLSPFLLISSCVLMFLVATNLYASDQNLDGDILIDVVKFYDLKTVSISNKKTIVRFLHKKCALALESVIIKNKNGVKSEIPLSDIKLYYKFFDELNNYVYKLVFDLPSDSNNYNAIDIKLKDRISEKEVIVTANFPEFNTKIVPCTENNYWFSNGVQCLELANNSPDDITLTWVDINDTDILHQVVTIEKGNKHTIELDNLLVGSDLPEINMQYKIVESDKDIDATIILSRKPNAATEESWWNSAVKYVKANTITSAVVGTAAWKIRGYFAKPSAGANNAGPTTNSRATSDVFIQHSSLDDERSEGANLPPSVGGLSGGTVLLPQPYNIQTAYSELLLRGAEERNNLFLNSVSEVARVEAESRALEVETRTRAAERRVEEAANQAQAAVAARQVQAERQAAEAARQVQAERQSREAAELRAGALTERAEANSFREQLARRNQPILELQVQEADRSREIAVEAVASWNDMLQLAISSRNEAARAESARQAQAERKVRENAERQAAEAANQAQAAVVEERQAREDAERQAMESEELQGRVRIEADSQTAESTLRVQAAHQALENAKSRAAESARQAQAERKARENAERQAAEAANQAQAAVVEERQAREDTERQAMESEELQGRVRFNPEVVAIGISPPSEGSATPTTPTTPVQSNAKEVGLEAEPKIRRSIEREEEFERMRIFTNNVSQDFLQRHMLGFVRFFLALSREGKEAKLNIMSLYRNALKRRFNQKYNFDKKRFEPYDKKKTS